VEFFTLDRVMTLEYSKAEVKKADKGGGSRIFLDDEDIASAKHAMKEYRSLSYKCMEVVEPCPRKINHTHFSAALAIGPSHHQS
jgi:hypothetical protein